MSRLSRRDLLTASIGAGFSRNAFKQQTANAIETPDPNEVYEASVFAENMELRFILHDDHYPLVDGTEILRIRGTLEEIRKDGRLRDFRQGLPIEFAQCDKSLEMIAETMKRDPNHLMNSFYSDFGSHIEDIPTSLPFQFGKGTIEDRIFRVMALELFGQRYDIYFKVRYEWGEYLDAFGVSAKQRITDLMEFAIVGPKVVYNQYTPLLLRRGTKTEEEWQIMGEYPYQNHYWKFSLKGGKPMVGAIDISGVQTKLLEGLRNQAVAYDKRERNLIIF